MQQELLIGARLALKKNNMALQSRGFEVTNIPRAQGIDFNLQPGQFTAGLNSGIGAYNAFSNIAEEVRDRPLRQRERESRLAQIEAEAQMAPVRRQLTEIQLAKAGLPEDIVTGSTVVRVPREDAPDQYDLVEQIEGFTFDPTTEQRTPFKRAGKMVTSSEEISNRQQIRNAEVDRINALRDKAAADKVYRDDILAIRKKQEGLSREKFNQAKAEADKRAQQANLVHVVGEVDGVLYSTFVSKSDGGIVSRTPLGVGAVRDADFLDQQMGNKLPTPTTITRGQPVQTGGNPPPSPAPVAPAPASTPQAAPKAQAIQDVGIGVLDSIDDNGQPIITESAMTYDQGLPVFPQNTLSTSKGYKIIPR